MPSAWFIAIDGVDGAGKTTQCQLLAEWLTARGYPTVQCRDPGTTVVGEQIRQWVLHPPSPLSVRTEMLLYMASRSQLVEEIVVPALRSGRSVVSDRYLLANVVYQGYGAGLDPATIWYVGRIATGDVLPDLTLVLDLDVAVAARRKQKWTDRIEERGVEFLERVRQGYLSEARAQPQRIRVIHAEGSPEDVHRRVCAEVQHVLGLGGTPERS
ncbi:MAG: dTMP kinase [Gemmataceae bacterium]